MPQDDKDKEGQNIPNDGGEEDAFAKAAAGEEPNDDDSARLKAELANQGQSLDQIRRWIAQQQQANTPSPDNKPISTGDNDAKTKLNEGFWNDPAGYSATIANNIVGTVAQKQFDQLAPILVHTAKERARSKNPKLFGKYEAEISAKMADLDPRLQINPDHWDTAFKMILGEHIEDIRREGVNNGSTDGPLPSSSKTHVNRAKELELSPDEIAYAKRFGLSSEEYQDGKKLLDKPSQGWEDVFTFDSREKRRVSADAS